MPRSVAVAASIKLLVGNLIFKTEQTHLEDST